MYSFTIQTFLFKHKPHFLSVIFHVIFLEICIYIENNIQTRYSFLCYSNLYIGVNIGIGIIMYINIVPLKCK